MWRGRAPWLSARRAPDHLSPAGPRPFPVGWGRRAERTPVEALPCTAAARRMRTVGQVRGALTSWHSPSPFAVTLNIRVSCPPRSKLPSPPSPGSSRLRQRGRCGGAPGPAAAARPGPGAPPSAARSRRRLRGARRSARSISRRVSDRPVVASRPLRRGGPRGRPARSRPGLGPASAHSFSASALPPGPWRVREPALPCFPSSLPPRFPASLLPCSPAPRRLFHTLTPLLSGPALPRPSPLSSGHAVLSWDTLNPRRVRVPLLPSLRLFTCETRPFNF